MSATVLFGLLLCSLVSAGPGSETNEVCDARDGTSASLHDRPHAADTIKASTEWRARWASINVHV